MSSIKETAEKVAGFSLVAYHDNADAVRRQIAADIEKALRDRDERAARIADSWQHETNVNPARAIAARNPTGILSHDR